MAFTPRSLVLSKLSIILSSSLAHNNSGRMMEWMEKTHLSPPLPETDNNTLDAGNSSCADPCADLNHAIHGELLVLIPTVIALVFSLLAVLPTLVQKSRTRIQGIKSYLWVLLQVWVHLLIAHYLFTQRKDKAQAYVWALHASSHVLFAWEPKKVVRYPRLHSVLTMAGAASVGLFAWQFGPAVGLAAWFRRGDALCGFTVHLVAILGIEFAQWVLVPVELLIAGL